MIRTSDLIPLAGGPEARTNGSCEASLVLVAYDRVPYGVRLRAKKAFGEDGLFNVGALSKRLLLETATQMQALGIRAEGWNNRVGFGGFIFNGNGPSCLVTGAALPNHGYPDVGPDEVDFNVDIATLRDGVLRVAGRDGAAERGLELGL